ncbi:hypothetical protein [Aeromicrobium sp.]|uniref:hypothetical protein n=1 Tax=Aeromicrobium sp. TaxID=1871063 RepID=UPI002FC6C57E
MKPPGTLKVSELRAAMERLLTAIEEQIGPEIDIPVDFYWNVPNSAAYKVGKKPKLDVGSVVDDVQSVSDYASEPVDEHTAIWHECEHVAGVLRAIAQVDMR